MSRGGAENSRLGNQRSLFGTGALTGASLQTKLNISSTHGSKGAAFEPRLRTLVVELAKIDYVPEKRSSKTESEATS